MVDAPGEPGQPPRWVPTGKSGVGRNLRDDTRVWFTVGRGILNEIAYPRIEQTAVRDFGLIVTDGGELFAEEQQDCTATTSTAGPGIPSYRVESVHNGGRFRLHKRIIADPVRPAVLQHLRLEQLGEAGAAPLRLHALLAPHLVNVTGMGSAWIGEYKGVPMLFAEGQGTAVAVAASCGWKARSAGYAGISDGWQDLSRHGRMSWEYERAINGNVALTGELDLERCAPDAGGERGISLVLGFGRIWTEAAMRARASLHEDFDALAVQYEGSWRRLLDAARPLADAERPGAEEAYRASLMAIHVHEYPAVPGARIASLGVPWAALRDADYPAACHLVRNRDVTLAARALLATGEGNKVLEAVRYLHSVQEADGTWPQNFWLDGIPAWHGLVLGETGRPVLLADLAWRSGLLDEDGCGRHWPMVRAAALALVRHHPLAGLDRWGREDGAKFETLGVSIVALLAAAEWADRAGDGGLAAVFRDTADSMRELLDGLVGEDGTADGADPDIVTLVLLGLMRPDDPRLLRALAAIDAELGNPPGTMPGWRPRGEAGGPVRPALTAERGLLAVMAGDPGRARALLDAVEASAGDGGMLPERLDDPSGRGGIVQPHLWSHAAHVRLLAAIADGGSRDRLPQAANRYGIAGGTEPATPRIARWRLDHGPATIAHGRVLRVEVPFDAVVHWTADGWKTTSDTVARRVAPGLCMAELPTNALAPGTAVVFTWRDAETQNWIGYDYAVSVAE
ncbi:MAG: glucan 1,4-alpha-glucosidase [Gluconacetobacter diazotrophicus]|nr:glucan 1,4-alpha-glucosidase [Gluconacetobacter diazotrophicus]